MTSKTGTLYLCATPIGNLEDMTFRAVRMLQEVDLIAAEDTRNSIRLLNHFDIHTPMTSYHEYNRIEKGHRLVSLLLEGKNIALITDAGTPGISDPGEDLVRMCRELKTETRTTILYEAPHRLKKTLQELRDILGNRRLSICRELTKKFETVAETTLEEAAALYEQQEPRGEYVLVLEGRSRSSMEEEERSQYEKMSVREHVERYEAQGMDRKEAMKQAAKDRGVSKRDIYQELLNEDGDQD